MKSIHDSARPTTPWAYLASRERRLRCALACKAKLGVFIPQQGEATAEEGQRDIRKRLHNTINYRAMVLEGGPAPDIYGPTVANMLVSVRRSREHDGTAKDAVMRHTTSPKDRQRMTARRWAHRLGWLGERADHYEDKRRNEARFKDADQHIWRTTKDFTCEGGHIVLRAGTRVFWDDGSFYTGRAGSTVPSITLRGADIRRAGIKRR